MNVNKDLFGHALSQFYFKKDPAKLYSESDISHWDEYPLTHLFRDFDQMPEIERQALSLAKGKILDVGCGAGSHSLYLQNLGLEVHSIDLSKGAAQIAQSRGVAQVTETSLLDYDGEGFDTIIMLMNGTGIFESLASVPMYLNKLKTLLNPKGMLLIDSSDLRYMYDTGDDKSIWVPADRYYGELEFRLRYKKEFSEKFPWLFMDKNLFAHLAESNGWTFEMVCEGDHYDYLAKLMP
jgi:SAM-dependent methyltransferase